MKNADIKIGDRCNNDCFHCVIPKRARSVGGEEYMLAITAAARRGCTSITVTGGEPTIHGQINDILAHAKRQSLAVTLQTNARRLGDSAFAKSLHTLVDTFVIALHGSNPGVHDSITRRRGSFRQTVAGVRNVSGSGAEVVAKVVLSSRNANDLLALAGLIADLSMDVAFFSFPHGLAEAKRNYEELVVRYSILWPLLRPAIDVLTENGVEVYLETIPFCIVNGYEEHVAELLFWVGDSEVQFPYREPRDWDALRLQQKRKFEQCKGCCFDPICEGVWSEYAVELGGDEFMPRHDVESFRRLSSRLARNGGKSTETRF